MLFWIVVTVAAVFLLRIILRYNIAVCTSTVKMTGKVVIVTGANAGIGFYTARDLAERGARVILACRNDARGTRACEQIIEETGNRDVVYRQLDLASLASVRRFCDDFTRTEGRLDVLVNNAGVYGFGDRHTADGIIEAMQVNLFAPMLLTDLLLPLLKASAGRIVNVSSLMHYVGELKPEKVNEIGRYGDLRTYSNSKYGGVVFTAELERALRGSGAAAHACHPGVVHTRIVGAGGGRGMAALFAALCWLCGRPAAAAAHTAVWLALGAAARGGGFYVDCARWPAAPRASSPTQGQALRQAAETLLRCKLTNIV